MTIADKMLLAEKVGRHLLAKGWKLVTAESCTGGGVAECITSIPGCASWFERGLVTYSNISKQELLNVSMVTLETFGAVSEQTALEMAIGALGHSQATLSLSITGIAGPEGGSPEKPVGLVWFAWAITDTHTGQISCLPAKSQIFQGDRDGIRQQAITFTLNELLKL